MVKHCLKCMPGLQTLTLVLKQFLRERGLNETYYGGVSSYTIFLMLVRYLQDHFPPLFEGEAFEEIAKKEEWARHILNLKAETDRSGVKRTPSDEDNDGVENSTPNGARSYVKRIDGINNFIIDVTITSSECPSICDDNKMETPYIKAYEIHKEKASSRRIFDGIPLSW